MPYPSDLPVATYLILGPCVVRRNHSLRDVDPHALGRELCQSLDRTVSQSTRHVPLSTGIKGAAKTRTLEIMPVPQA
jgi:hypothetical protein